jgi:structural maintenance of chromosome 4
VAVSTACGAGFESILVENQWAAEQCVNFLRNNKIGRYTFICLEQVRKLYSQE